VGLALLSVFAAFSLFPAVFAPYGPKEMFDSWQQPSQAHLLGTNDMGYDIFSELVFAASATLSVGVAAALAALVIGTTSGLLAVCASPVWAELFSLLITVFLQIPMLPAAIVITAFLGPGRLNIVITISLLGWCATARTVRSQAASLMKSGFVETLRILGLSRGRIIFFHLLPNLREVVLARYIMSVSACMMTEASLSFMGLGDPVHVTWGGMINFAFRRGGFSRGAANWFLAPGLCVTLCVLAFYCLNWYGEQRSRIVEGGTYLD
jgi:peptide/nickel transport system permease protein